MQNLITFEDLEVEKNSIIFNQDEDSYDGQFNNSILSIGDLFKDENEHIFTPEKNYFNDQ